MTQLLKSCGDRVSMWVVANTANFNNYTHQVDALRGIYSKHLMGIRKVKWHMGHNIPVLMCCTG